MPMPVVPTNDLDNGRLLNHFDDRSRCEGNVRLGWNNIYSIATSHISYGLDCANCFSARRGDGNLLDGRLKFP